ncbi:hypothetical protein AALP_AA3G338300 [Arabis alpina]|uniref:Uncharacterized protein n=1 Tax=Arabis alpina TaxID=50452 RepID=A0A087HDF9_ARAAL|nr:hypothetical protein AALP_AA3G338300 [Arabis alpina]
MDQLPNYIGTLPNCNEVGITIEDVDEMLLDLVESKYSKQDLTNVPIVVDHDCSNNPGSISNKIKPLVNDLSRSTLTNVHLIYKLVEESKIPVSNSATSFEECGTQTRDLVPKGVLLKGPLPQRAVCDTNLERIHKKLRILKDARQGRKW